MAGSYEKVKIKSLKSELPPSLLGGIYLNTGGECNYIDT